MATLPAQDWSVDLRAVTVRPTWGAQEHRRWDRLVAEHHYLPFHGVIGKGLRHVAVHGETWLALIGWQPGAFKLAARDRWIGWPAEQQFRRLHLIANNSRFVILTPGRVHNLASRVLGLSLRRLSQDIQAVHGYPVFLAETFVDVSRFVGTCYRASNWRSLGLTRGFAREPGGSARWRHHGQPKEIFVFELTDAAAEALSRTEVPAHWNAVRAEVGDMNPGQDQEPRVVDHEREVLLTQLRRPAQHIDAVHRERAGHGVHDRREPGAVLAVRTEA